jgi:hypothetical protein
MSIEKHSCSNITNLALFGDSLDESAAIGLTLGGGFFIFSNGSLPQIIH